MSLRACAKAVSRRQSSRIESEMLKRSVDYCTLPRELTGHFAEAVSAGHWEWNPSGTG